MTDYTQRDVNKLPLIAQAEQEMLERVRSTLPKYTIGKCFSCEECSCKMKYKDGFNYAIFEVDDLLSSLSPSSSDKAEGMNNKE